MRIFVTGATGFIGSAIVEELLSNGHQVLGLTRSDAGAEKLRQQGAEPHHGELTDLASLQRGAEAADGVIHTAFIHDFSKFKENCEIDYAAITAMGEVLAGSNRPFAVASGTGLLTGTLDAPADENQRYLTSTFPRVASERAVDAVAERGVRAMAIRLTPTVHDTGDHGFVPLLIDLARKTGQAAYIGDGSNVWPAVHRRDAARLFRLAAESGTPGARYHGAAELGIPFRSIAEVIGRHLNLPVVSKAAGDEAAAHFGWFVHFAGINNPTSSQLTQQQLNWHPTHPGLIADLDRPAYFETSTKFS